MGESLSTLQASVRRSVSHPKSMEIELIHLYAESDSFDARYNRQLSDHDAYDPFEPTGVNWRELYDLLEDDGVLGFSTTYLGRIRNRIKPSLPRLSTIESIIYGEPYVYEHDYAVQLVRALAFASVGMKEWWLCWMAFAVVNIFQSWEA